MAFYGRSFIYNNIPSDYYGLLIGDLDSGGVNETMGSSNMEILDQKIYRRATPFFYGATPSPILTFDMSAFSENEIDSDFFRLIQKVFFSSKKYSKLQIVQDDMAEIYFDAILNDPKIIRVGNLLRGISFTVTCSSPFAWNFPKTTTYTYSTPTIDSTVIFNNSSDDNGSYLYPSNVITMNSFGGNITITNLSDSNRVFSFTGLQAGEVITIDNSLQTISSSTGLKRLSNFNKKFLRLIPGVNNLRIQGAISTATMTCQFVSRRIGG
jgi:phage-related protein